LPKDRQTGLLLNLRRVKAQGRIERQIYDPEDHEGVYQLYMDAYGDQGLADEARLSSLRAVMKRETDAAR